MAFKFHNEETLMTLHPAATRRVRPAIDMRADIIAKPTEAMWAAMRNVELGWYVSREDPSVNELERRMAQLTGKEAAFYVASGGLGNILGVMGLTQPGDEVVMEKRCHIYWAEGMNAASIAGVATRLVPGNKFGEIEPDELEAVFADNVYGYHQQTTLVCLENTHNVAGGTTLSPAYLREISAVAKAHGARVFVDGARLWNAAEYCGVSLAEMLEGVDATMISLNKGLGAPWGAIICGSAAFIARSRLNIRRLGSSGHHRAGMFAAAALVALDTMVERLSEDHRRARRLAEGLNEIPGLYVDMETVQTNIIRMEVTAPGLDARTFAEGLLVRGVGCRELEAPSAVKFVTWSEQTDEDIEEALRICRAYMADVSA
jgi:threonine aldolase